MSAVRWRKSSYSGETINCVEVAFGWGVRDSKDPDGGRLTVGRAAYEAFLRFARRR